MRTWPEKLGAREGENHACMSIGFMCVLLLPWMLIFTRAGAEICTALIGITFLWRSAALRDWRWVQEPFVKMGMLAWLWLMLVVSPFALESASSFFHALPWIRYLLLFIAIRYWLLTTRTALTISGIMLALVLSLCALDTLWQYTTSVSLTNHIILESGRLTGPFDRPKIGMYMARMMIPAQVILVIAMLDKPWRYRALLFVGVIAWLGVILLSGERTAFVMAMGVFGLVAMCVALYVRHARITAVSLVIILIGAMFLLLQTQPRVQQTLTRTVSNVENFSHSPYGEVFSAAWQTGKAYWTTGVGMRGFRQVLTLGEVPEIKKKYIHVTEEKFIHAHNPYLEWFAEAGLPGLLLFAAMVGCLLRETIQLMLRVRGLAIIIPSFMLGAWLFNFFPVMSTQSYFSNWTGIMVWYCLATTFSTRALLTSSDMWVRTPSSNLKPA